MNSMPMKKDTKDNPLMINGHDGALSLEVQQILNMSENFLDKNRKLTAEFSEDHEFLELFFYKELNKDGDLSENTLKAYRYDARTLFEFLSLTGKNLKDIAYPEVEAFNLYTRKKYSVRSARRKLEFLRRLLVFGKKTNFYPENWADYINKPKLKQKGHYSSDNEDENGRRKKAVLREMEQTEAKSITEIFSLIPVKKKKFRDILIARNRLIGALLYGTGMRASEICNLDFDSIRSKGGALYLDVIAGKGNKDRTVPIMDSVQEALKSYIYELKKEFNFTEKFLLDKPLLFSPYGLDKGSKIKRLSYESLYKLVKLAVNVADSNPHISPHWFRHSYVTMMLENNVPLAVVKDLVGHADISTTNIYLEKINEDKKHEHLSGLSHLGL